MEESRKRATFFEAFINFSRNRIIGSRFPPLFLLRPFLFSFWPWNKVTNENSFSQIRDLEHPTIKNWPLTKKTSIIGQSQRGKQNEMKILFHFCDGEEVDAEQNIRKREVAFHGVFK